MTPSAYDVARQTLAILLPEILLLLTATVMMTAGVFVRLSRRVWCLTATGGLVVALLILLANSGVAIDPYSGVALNDAFSLYARLILLLAALIVMALAHDQVDEPRAPEFFGSLLFINAGAMLVASANELVFLFVGLELVSIPTYLLLYLPRRTAATQEAATKYFFLSIFSSGLLLFGMAYLYGLTGVSNLKALAYLGSHAASVPQPQLALIALVFMMAGLGFRVAAVPFHFYAPDVYQGSPLIVAALLSWIPKAVGYFAILRTVTAVISAAGAGTILNDQAVLLAAILAGLTMTLGNTVALYQDNLKRLLAYSSIAHAGYLMIGVAVAFRDVAGSAKFAFGAEGILFYLTTYAFMTLGVFGIILLLGSPARPVETVDDLAGLGRTQPLAALGLAICLFSLAGIPPLAGFMGKLELFGAGFMAAWNTNSPVFFWLAILAVLNSAIGAYYYLRIVVVMYLRDSSREPVTPNYTWPAVTAVAACVVFTVYLGIFPGLFFRSTHAAAESALSLPEPDGQTGALAVIPESAGR